jgi:threonine/homoserine/homoserine lactone efflux protein
MGSLLVSLLPFIIGSALVPIQNIINILLLKSPQQGLLKASAYVGGMTTLRLLQGLIFGLLFIKEEGGGKSPVVLTLQIVLGILLLVTAYKQWRGEDDPDAPPPKWITSIDNLTPMKAFGFGFGVVLISGKLWVFTLSAISLIDAAQLGQPSGAIAYLVFVLLAESLLVLTLIFRLGAPKKSISMLEQASAWMTRYNRLIVLSVSLVFGLLFLYQGASGLLSL